MKNRANDGNLVWDALLSMLNCLPDRCESAQIEERCASSLNRTFFGHAVSSIAADESLLALAANLASNGNADDVEAARARHVGKTGRKMECQNETRRGRFKSC